MAKAPVANRFIYPDAERAGSEWYGSVRSVAARIRSGFRGGLEAAAVANPAKAIWKHSKPLWKGWD